MTSSVPRNCQNLKILTATTEAAERYNVVKRAWEFWLDVMGSTRRRSTRWKKRNSTADRRTGPTVPGRVFCRWNRRPCSSRFASTRCCRSKIANCGR